jgi:glycosyltransferase involved in cell wall biosynthesis
VPPDVTVVIPTRDRRELLLAHGLRSAREQEGVALEILVVDDGSADGTAAAVEALGDERIRVLRSPASQGVARARNRGLAEARGRWVAFLDDDDLWAPTKLRTHTEALERDGAGIAYGGTLWLDAGRRVRGDYPPTPAEQVRSSLMGHNAIGTPSNVVMATEAARAAGGFEPSLSVFADWDLWLRVVDAVRPVAVPGGLVAYYVHPQSMHLDTRAHAAETRALRARHVDKPLGGRVHREWVVGAHLSSGRRARAARSQLALARAERSWRDAAEAVKLVLGRTALQGYVRRAPIVRDPRPVLPAPPWLDALLRGPDR